MSSKSSCGQLADVFTRRASYAKAVVALFPDATCEVTPGEDKYESSTVKEHSDCKAEYFVMATETAGAPLRVGARWYVEVKPRGLPPIRVYDRLPTIIPLGKVVDMLNERRVPKAAELLKSA